MMTEVNVTDVFIGRLLSLRKKVSCQDIRQAKLCLLDLCGTLLAGQLAYSHTLELYASFMDSACKSEDSRLMATNGVRKPNMVLLAFQLAYAAHSTEMDDGERMGMVHPGAPVIASLMALSSVIQIEADDLLVGLVVGYEATISLARAMQPSLKKNGYHATGVCGCIGAAMACGTALNFSEAQLKIALSAAVTSASGLLEAITGDSELKAYNAANAAYSGLMATAAGIAGIKCPNDMLGGNRGILHNFCREDLDLSAISQSSERALIHHIYRKPYAACRHCHPAIDGALELRAKEDFSLEAIENVVLETYDLAVFGHDHRDVNSPASAKMSIPYSVAVAIIKGKAGLDEFAKHMIDSRDIRNLIGKVTVSEDPELSRKVPVERAAKIRINLKDGGSRQAYVNLPKGEPEKPMSDVEIINKFRDLARYAEKNPDEISVIENMLVNDKTDIPALLSVMYNTKNQ